MADQEFQNQTYAYKKFLPWENDTAAVSRAEYSPDARSGAVYLHNPSLQLVTEIAIVTQRPLLLKGEPGSGKSSFAPFVARNLGWRYYEFNVTGRTEAKDLLWRFDALRRLRDAQARSGVIDANQYITPGVLWWAFNYNDAFDYVRRHRKPKRAGQEAEKTEDAEPFADINASRDKERVVVLIDEIDKADPNVPNDLLEVIGVNRFTIDETRHSVKRENLKIQTDKPSNKYGGLFIVITTNEERDLPPAFIRRCIVHSLEESADRDLFIKRWLEIARLHMAREIESSRQKAEITNKLVEKCWELRQKSKNMTRRSPSVAEFLDALRICFQLKINPESEVWQQVEQNVLIKT